MPAGKSYRRWRQRRGAIVGERVGRGVDGDAYTAEVGYGVGIRSECAQTDVRVVPSSDDSRN